MKVNNKKSVPKAMSERYEELAKLINDFCMKNLNEEYVDVCTELCAALCRKRPSPLVSGAGNAWACGIVHAVGFVNFLFDSSQKPHIKASELYDGFGVSNSTGLSKSKQIRDLLKMSQFDPKWTLPSKMEDNPLVWMITVDGFPMDVRHAPEEIQRLAYERGLIPYVPYDKIKEEKFDDKIISFDKAKKLRNNKLSEEKRLEKAYDSLYEAWEASNSEERLRLARKAIETSENCVEAYVLLADESNISDEEKKKLYEKAVKAGETIIGQKNFKIYEGDFWGIPETKPYMMAKYALADFLWSIGRRKEAIDHCKDMLRLNTNDNQGIRNLVINWVIEENDDEYAQYLLDFYDEDIFSAMLYSKSLFLFKTGKVKEAESALKIAMKQNPHVPLYLLGLKRLPKYPPESMSFGDEDEAAEYAFDSYAAWLSVDGATKWLRKFID